MLGRWSRPSRLYMVAGSTLALIGVLLLHGYLTGVARAADPGGPRVPIVVAATGISRGTALRSNDLRVVRWPRAYAPPGAFGTIGQAAGRVALADLSTGEAVTRTRLARVRAGPVASLIPEGLRAFAVPTSLPGGVVARGDLVDVLATYASGQPHTETVVTGVEVLFVIDGSGASGIGTVGAPAAGGAEGGSPLDAGSATTGADTLIVLVSPDQEQRLAFARAFADLSVAVQPAPATSPGG